MEASHATAEVFLKAFRALPKADRDAFIVRVAEDKTLRRDLMDLAVFAERRNEPSRPFRDYLAKRKK